MNAVPAAAAAAPSRGRVWAWGMWDWGSSAFNTIVLTFVFSVYLTDSVGKNLPEGSLSPNAWLSWSTAAAGLLIALMAPVIGQSADRAGHRLRSTGVWTAAVVVAMLLMFFVRNDDYHYLWLGLLLLGLASIFFELAQVSYFALLSQVSTPENVGRVSGFGWALGYFGGIILLAVSYFGFIADDGGLLGVSTEGGLNIRIVVLVAAVWFTVFALPMFLTLPEIRPTGERTRLGVVGSYRALLANLRALLRDQPHTVYFLGASALFRDGLNAIFAFGGVIAVTVYGMDPGTVLIFGVVINVVSALGALAGGRLDDRIGPKAVVVGSLAGLVVVGLILLFVSGTTLFWVFGLILGLFVGPAQASSRSYLSRLCPEGQEGQLFGLYATTGRAVSFISPALIGLFTVIGGDRLGLLGIILVLVAGLAAVLPVRKPDHVRPAPAVTG
ncbi:MFS transporter [Pseudonocardia endophytica]|uniref:UMF1 family MFS transporter n=1 Tax=Pseudonocardia endophytica TaxID=401976 RepID=A0A4R1HPH9_PSEEN|nr:MFS transporter [Pseudonocardia endophytica]TCK23053.1 UMF1 family MFS transporter [Pseudonocardia endophytica]